MAQDIDNLLNALASRPSSRSLAGLEPAVWSRIERDRTESGLGGGLRFQAAVAAGALVLGVLVAGVADREPIQRAEMVVLSEDAGLALSVAVEGGA